MGQSTRWGRWRGLVSYSDAMMSSGRISCRHKRSAAISVVRGWQTTKREIASQGILSSRGTKRSRLFGAGKQPRERLRRREFCHREERGDLGCSGLANNQKRDCRASLAMTRLFVLGCKQTKERLLRRLAMTRQKCVAISVVRGWQTEKGEIAALRSQ